LRSLDAEKLLAEVDALISEIKVRGGHRPDGAENWPCQVCGKGTYRPASAAVGTAPHLAGRPLVFSQIPFGRVDNRQPFSIFVCDYCGHAEFFKAYT
jgi:hypothetical protein